MAQTNPHSSLHDCTSQYIHCLSQSEGTTLDMDSQLALEALGALLGVTVKPLPEEDVPLNGPSEAVSSGSLLKAMTIRDAAPSRHTGETQRIEIRRGGPAVNELTVENFMSTVVDLQFQSEPLNGDAGMFFLLFSPDSSAKDGSPNDIPDSQKELFVNMNEFFDRKFNYDFRRCSDSSKCSRGGEPYARPWGWYRFALRVLNKYSDGNTWLGPSGWRNESGPGEWPVSFHGTSRDGAKAITETCYLHGKGQYYGPGIYSTPDIKVAEGYTKKFTSKNGKSYRVIMQNRINPEKREIVQARNDYWRIPVPEGTPLEEVKKIAEESIRPYGILIKEVK